MKRLLIIFALNILLFKTGFSQSYNYALISDMQMGTPKNNDDLVSIIHDINNRHDIKFVIVLGNLTANGADLQDAKKMLDSLTVPYYVIPGVSDLEWSPDAGQKFSTLFKNNFVFNYNGIEHIGLNTALYWNHYGHISPENLKWLDSTLSKLNDSTEIILYSFFPVNQQIDNWYEIVRRLGKFKIKEIITGSAGANRITNYYKIQAAELKSSQSDRKSWNYNLVTVNQDSLLFYSITKNNSGKLWGVIKKDTNTFDYPDSAQFEDYSANLPNTKSKIKVKLNWKHEFNTSVSSYVCSPDGKIFVTTCSGVISCLDSTGNLLWKYSSNEPIAGAPIVADNNLIAGTLQGDLISLDTNNGNVIQSIGLNVPLTSRLTTLNGEYNGEKSVGVIVGTAKGDMYFYDTGTFEQIWENHSAKDLILTKPLIITNRIIYGSTDGFLYCIEGRSGIINWKWADNRKAPSSSAGCLPVSDGRNVYVTSTNKNVTAIDLMLGQTVWSQSNYNVFGSLGMSTDKKLLYVKSTAGRFYKIMAANGRAEKIIKTDTDEDYLSTVPVEFNGGVLFASQNGCIYYLDSENKLTKLFFLGNSPILDIIKTNENTFLAGNRDGKVIEFNIE